MQKYQHLKKQSPEAFRRYTGLTPEVFECMHSILKQAYQEKHAQGGRKPKLSVADQLILTLSYYREYRTQFHLALDYQISESSVCKTIKWVESTLVKHPTLSLPSKKELWQNPDLEIVLIDATEVPVERPKKSKDNTTQARKNVIH